MRNKFLFLFVFAFSFSLRAQVLHESVAIEGVVFEKGTKRPLADINVFALPSKIKSVTSSSGQFRLEGVPLGETQILINAADYKKFEKTISIEQSPPAFNIYLERQAYTGLRETVVDRAKKRDDTTRTLKTEQFLMMPGANGDPVKAVQNLPGVARTNGFSSQVLIQGSAPQDTSYMLDEHNVPLIFHFGGITSVITPEAVEQVDYLSAGYGPEYGRAMGGLIGLRSKVPDSDRRRGFLFADLTKAGGLLQGPIDETSSYLISARYSYLSLLLKAAFKNSPRFDLTVAPAFSDLSFIYSKKATAQDDIKVLVVGSHDELKFVLNEPLREQPSVRGNFANETTFYRIIPQWTHRYDGGSIGRFSLGAGQDFLKIDAGENFLDIKTVTVTQRAELEQKLSPEWTSYLGMDNRYSRDTVSFALPIQVSSGGVGGALGSEKVVADVVSSPLTLAPYWRNRIKFDNSSWTLSPSVRAEYVSLTKETLLQPRMAIRYDQSESLFYRLAGGLYHQPPQPQELTEAYGNPDLKSPSATHLAAGLEKDFREGSTDGFVLQSTVFYKTFRDLVITSSARKADGTPERYSNNGTGRAHGLEVSLKYDAKPWTAWVAYTFSQSYRTTPSQGEYPFSNDQTHNVNIVGSLELPRNWTLATRARYVTGNPATPVIGSVFDSDKDVYVPVRGPFYSERSEPFFQLDIRADKKWIYNEWILWSYLDIQNATNRQNSEGIRYSYDYSQKTNVTGLPILPILGVRGEF